MNKPFILSAKNFLPILLILASGIIPLFYMDPIHENLSGLQGLAKGWIILGFWDAITIYFLADGSLSILNHFKLKTGLIKIILAGMFLSALTPYTFGGHGWIDDFHVVFASLSVFAFTAYWIWLYLSCFNPLIKDTAKLVVMIGFLSFALAGAVGKISGLSQVIYGQGISLILYIKKKQLD